MKIQSLSIVVPATRCINSCRFCVSRMRGEDYRNQMDANLPFYDLYEKDYIRRLEFARDNGCNTVMLTGNAEPQQNREFLQRFGTMNSNLQKPFRWIEMQTTGVLLDDPYLRFLRNHVGVSTISLSMSSLNSEDNAEINGTPMGRLVHLQDLCSSVKKYDFNLRLSLNLTREFDFVFPDNLLDMARNDFGADQVTFRVLYESEGFTPQDQWIKENRCAASTVAGLKDYIREQGRPLERLEYGAIKYSLHGMSVVLDDDCMSQEAREEYKYLILRPNCKLYSKWDDPASLIF